MMVNSKNKGRNFEYEILKVLQSSIKGSSWKRTPMSGAIGTIVDEGLLTGDINGKIDGFPRLIKVECKVGYNRGASKSFTIKKEWLDKVVAEAKRTYSVPVLIGKFENVVSGNGVKYFVVMDLDTFIWFIETIQEERRNG